MAEQMAPTYRAGLTPGANTSGTQTKQPGSLNLATTPAIGAQANPLLPSYPSGQSMPGISSPLNFPANTGGAPLPSTATLRGFGSPIGAATDPSHGNDYLKALEASGLRPGMAEAVANLMQSGLGYSPQVVQTLLAAMQPQIQRGEAQLMEQFGAAGLGESSAAAIGMGDYLSQVALQEGQLVAGLYEQSVQNYMSLLTSMSGIGEQYQATKMQTGGTVMGDITGMLGATSKFFTPMPFPGTQAQQAPTG